MWRWAGRASEFYRNRPHDPFIAVQVGKPVGGRPFNLVVSNKSEHVGGTGYADSLVERQQYGIELAEL